MPGNGATWTGPRSGQVAAPPGAEQPRTAVGPAWAWLALLLLVVLAVRMTALVVIHESHPARTLAEDSASYDRLAASLAVRGAFSANPGEDAEPDLIRTPGYPVFIAAVRKAFGGDGFWVLAVQVVLSALTLVPLYWAGASVWSAPVGLAAALIYAFDYIALLASQMLLTDSLYVFVLLVAVALGASALSGRQPYRVLLLLFGALLAAATLIRPVSYYLIVPVLVGFAVYYGRTGGWRRGAAAVMLIVLPWLVIVGGWQVRNFVVAGTPELSLIKGINLMRYRGAYIVARRDGLGLLEARERFKQEIPGHEHMTPVQRSAAYTQKALELMREHPGLALKGQITGTAQLLGVPGEAEVLRYFGLTPPESGAAGDLMRLSPGDFYRKWVVDNAAYLFVFILALGYLLVIYGGTGVALVNALRDSGPHVYAQVFLLGLAVYFIAVSGGPEGYPRLRMPITPILCLFAAAGWHRLLTGRAAPAA